MSSPLLLLLCPLLAHAGWSYSYHSYHPTTVYKSSIRTLPLPYKQPYLSYPNTKVVSKSNIKTSPVSYKQAFLNPSTLSLTETDDIIQQTRTQAESLKEDLRSMARNPRAAQILNKVFADKNNVCISSMEEAIEAIETSTQLFENGATEIKQLVDSIKVFENLKDTPTAVRETAKILRLLDVLIPKISPETTSTCRSTSDDIFGSLRSLGDLVEELSSRNDIYFSTQKRQSLKSSAKIVTRVTNFLSQLKNTFSKFDRICTRNKEYNIEVITAMGDMMTGLADLYRELGGNTAAQDISKQRNFTKQIVVSRS